MPVSVKFGVFPIFLHINLNSSSGSNPPNQTAPYQLSEFYGYDHDYAVAQVSWTNGTTAVEPSSTWAYVTGEGASSGTSLGRTIAQINLTLEYLSPSKSTSFLFM